MNLLLCRVLYIIHEKNLIQRAPFRLPQVSGVHTKCVLFMCSEISWHVLNVTSFFANARVCVTKHFMCCGFIALFGFHANTCSFLIFKSISSYKIGHFRVAI